MHPYAPCHAPVALVDQAGVVSRRRRRGGSRPVTWFRVMTLCVAMGGVSAALVWLKNESPHARAADATRESPLVEARSLQPLLETTESSPLAAYAMKKGEPADGAAVVPEVAEGPKARRRLLPEWLLADAPEFAQVAAQGLSPAQIIGQLRQSLRERGARQMGEAVRLAMLNVGELLAMTPANWEAGMTGPAANENRVSAMLLTFYLSFLDHDGDGAGVKGLMRAMEQGMTEEQAVREFVLHGRSVAELERGMSEAFAEAGVQLQFTRRGGMAFTP